MRLLALLRSAGLNEPNALRRELVTRFELASVTGLRHALRRFSQDLRHARADGFRRAKAQGIWTSAAAAIDAELIELGGGFVEIRKGKARTRIYEHTLPLNDQVAVLLANDKPRAQGLLRAEGIPVPDYLEFSLNDLTPAVEFLEQGSSPCIVKPVKGISGQGVTSAIRSPSDLRRAARWARRYGERLMIERQIAGSVYRLLVLDGVALDTVRCLPPRVTGDGQSTIAELIEAEYERRLEPLARDLGIRPLAVDLDCLLTLRRRGLTPRSIPAAGETVQVKTVTNQNRIEDNETVTDGIARELAAVAAASAATLGLRWAGIDVVTPDPRRGLAEAGGGVIDVNGAPGLWRHYRVSDPASVPDVVAAVLRRLLDT